MPKRNRHSPSLSSTRERTPAVQRSRAWKWFATCVAALAYGTGCDTSVTSSTTAVLVVLADDGDARTQAIEHSIRDATDFGGLDVEIRKFESLQEQRRLLQQLEAQESLQAVALQPLSPDGWEAIFARLRSQRIPLILIDRGVTDPSADYATQICGDPYEEGRLAAQFLCRELAANTRILELQSSFDAGPRSRALIDVTDQVPGATIVERRLVRSGQSGVGEWLPAYLSEASPPINAIFAHTAQIAAEVTTAIRESEKARRRDAANAKEKDAKAAPFEPRSYRVACVGADATTLVAVVDGGIDGVIDTPAEEVGPVLLQTLHKIERRTPLRRRTVIPSRLIDQKSGLRLLSRGRE